MRTGKLKWHLLDSDLKFMFLGHYERNGLYPFYIDDISQYILLCTAVGVMKRKTLRNYCLILFAWSSFKEDNTYTYTCYGTDDFFLGLGLIRAEVNAA